MDLQRNAKRNLLTKQIEQFNLKFHFPLLIFFVLFLIISCEHYPFKKDPLSGTLPLQI